jgi:hypothetical protein
MVFIDNGTDDDPAAVRLELRKRSRVERASQHDGEDEEKTRLWEAVPIETGSAARYASSTSCARRWSGPL